MNTHFRVSCARVIRNLALAMLTLAFSVNAHAYCVVNTTGFPIKAIATFQDTSWDHDVPAGEERCYTPFLDPRAILSVKTYIPRFWQAKLDMHARGNVIVKADNSRRSELGTFIPPEIYATTFDYLVDPNDTAAEHRESSYRPQMGKFDPAERDVRFIATADPQYWEDGSQESVDFNNNADSTLFWTNLQRIILDARGILIAGDLTQDGLEWEQQRFRDGVKNFRRYVYEGVGNHHPHDFSGLNIGHLEKDTVLTNRSISTDPDVNGVHYSWDWNDVHFVQLNIFPAGANAIGHHDHISPQQSLEFLQEDLALHVGVGNMRPVVLIHHYGWDIGSTGDTADPDSWQWWTQIQRDAYLNAIKSYNIVAIFTGHTHYDQSDSIDSVIRTVPGCSAGSINGNSGECLNITSGAARNGVFFDVAMSACNQLIVNRRGQNGEVLQNQTREYDFAGVSHDFCPKPPAPAEHGGPYEVDEGANIELSSPNEDVDPERRYAWSLFDPNDTGPIIISKYNSRTSLNSSWQVPRSAIKDGPLSWRVEMQVIGSSSRQTTLSVKNVAPTVESLTAQWASGGDVLLTGRIVDPGDLDTHTMRIDWGDGVVETISPAGMGNVDFTEEHSYSGSGVYSISVEVTDKDGGKSSKMYATVTIPTDNVTVPQPIDSQQFVATVDDLSIVPDSIYEINFSVDNPINGILSVKILSGGTAPLALENATFKLFAGDAELSTFILLGNQALELLVPRGIIGPDSALIPQYNYRLEVESTSAGTYSVELKWISPRRHELGDIPVDGTLPAALINDAFTLDDFTVHWFEFSVPELGYFMPLQIEASLPAGENEESDTFFFLYDTDDKLIVTDDDGGVSRYSKLQFSGRDALSPGSYTLVVARYTFNIEEDGMPGIDNGSGFSLDLAFKDIDCDPVISSRRVNIVQEWQLLTLPCSAPTGSTMADLVVSNSSSTGNVDWKAFEYDASLGNYKPLQATSAIPAPGSGFWFISPEPVTLQMPEGSVTGLNPGVPIPASTRWNLIGNSSGHPHQFFGMFAENSSIGCTLCRLGESENHGFTSHLWLWDDIARKYARLGDVVQVAEPWQGYWSRFDLHDQSTPVDTPWRMYHVPSPVPLPNLVEIPGGSFTIGSPVEESHRDFDEDQRQVNIQQAFKISSHEVTFEQYDAYVSAVQGGVPSDDNWGRGSQPVINVSWADANAYAAWLSDQTGHQYRLPTEAEWEYAARADTVWPFHTGTSIWTTQANYDGTTPYAGTVPGIYRQRPIAVGTFEPNAWGLFDVHGNVAEWTCSDYVDPPGVAQETCATADTTMQRSLRGGSWQSKAWGVRAADRATKNAVTDFRENTVGFRLVRE